MKILSRENLNTWLDGLAAQHVLIAPHLEAQGVFYRPVQRAQEVAWQAGRPALSAKEFLFPSSERLLKGERRGPDVRLEGSPSAVPQVLFGLRPCDARGIRILDAAFLDTPPIDCQYASRRENTLLLGLACRSMGPSCFCTAMGLAPDDPRDMDVMFTDRGPTLAVQARTPRGEALIASLPKKVMAPEDWKLDPEFDKKFAEKFSWYTADSNGNGPTSAALARYDNPRARKMYEFVRDLLEKRSSGDKRLRGIELVK